MGRITSTQAIFFSPGTNWAGEKHRAKDKDKGWLTHGIQKHSSWKTGELASNIQYIVLNYQAIIICQSDISIYQISSVHVIS